MPFPSPLYKQTTEAMDDPQVGDRFTEMFTFYVYVLDVSEGEIVTIEGSPPCIFPDDGLIRRMTVDKFRERFGYGTIDGYWVVLLDRGNNVAGWLDNGRDENLPGSTNGLSQAD